MEAKLAKLREGVTLVSPEERKAVEGMYSEMINQWRRRKRMFKDIWDAITENSPKDLKEFKVLYKFIIYAPDCQKFANSASKLAIKSAGRTWHRV